MHTNIIHFIFFRLPKDPERRKIWIHKIRRENWTPTETTVICYKHFALDDFEAPAEHRKKRDLKRTATPSVFSYPDHLQPKQPKFRKPPIERASHNNQQLFKQPASLDEQMKTSEDTETADSESTETAGEQTDTATESDDSSKDKRRIEKATMSSKDSQGSKAHTSNVVVAKDCPTKTFQPNGKPSELEAGKTMTKVYQSNNNSIKDVSDVTSMEVVAEKTNPAIPKRISSLEDGLKDLMRISQTFDKDPTETRNHQSSSVGKL